MLLWGSIIGYLAVLFLAAVWAIVERTRSAIVDREGGLLPRAPLNDEAVELAGPPSAISVDAV